MNSFGRAGAYFALFSEIGILLLVTTLLGVGAGYWLDERLGTLPIFLIVGFLAGAGVGTIGIAQLIRRFLVALDADDRKRRGGD